MFMKLYGVVMLFFVCKICVVLVLKGLDYEVVYVDFNNKFDGYEKISLLQWILVLEVDGYCLVDFVVICVYLEKIYLELVFYFSDLFQYVCILWFEKYVDYELVLYCIFMVFCNWIVKCLMGQDCDEVVIVKVLESCILLLLDYLEWELDGCEYLVGDSFIMVDIVVVS